VRQPRLRVTFLAMAVSATLCACVEGDHASITIDYPVTTPANRWTLEPTARQRVVAAFSEIAAAKGYKCHAHPKRVQELTCRGPKDMHVTFKPELNKPEFIAVFNWVAWHGRTHAEFTRHIDEFASAMKKAVTDAEIHTS
jgi:hypothetical protein